MTTKLFSELGISAELLKAIDRLGFEQAAPIQAEAIPLMMQGRDVVGQSQTGSGKTAAFVVPLIEKTDPKLRVPQALILCPTRELAIQVSEEVQKLAFFKHGIHALPVYGGQSYERQFSGLKQGAQIIIGTPGRVMDHMRRGTLRLQTVKMVVLDEADTMLDMGFRDDIEVILQAIPAERQTVFFSATMPRIIQDLVRKYARDPQSVRIEQKALTVPTVEQLYYEVDRRYKVELLTRLIDLHDFKLGIVFCSTKRMVDELVDQLNAQGYSADKLHGDMSQFMRDRVMNKFRKSGLEFLVATDVAARGIDVDDVEVVFNYDLPYDVEDYVHRIGRTGRAGRSGRAISFVSGRELFQINNIERYTRTRIQRAKIPSEAEVDEVRANAFLEKLRETLKSGEFKRQDNLIERLLEEGFNSTDIASALLHHLQCNDQPPAVPERSASERSSSDRDDRRDYRESRDDRGPRDYRDSGSDRGPRSRDDRPSNRVSMPQREARVTARPVPPITLAPRTPLKTKTLVAVPPAQKVESVVPATPIPPATSVSPVAGLKSELTANVLVPAPAVPPPNRPLEGVSPTRKLEPVVPATPIPPVTPVKPVPAVKPERTVEASAPAPIMPPKTGPMGVVPVPKKIKPVVPAAPIPLVAPVKPAAERDSVVLGNAIVLKRPLGSVRLPARKSLITLPNTAPQEKPSRRTPTDQTRLYMNVGAEMGVTSDDVMATILGETGCPPSVVGTVDIRERHLFVDVAAESAAGIIAKLNRARLKNLKIKVKIA